MVTLNDVNDNAPRLPMIPPLSVQAGETHRTIAQVSHPMQYWSKFFKFTFHYV